MSNIKEMCGKEAFEFYYEKTGSNVWGVSINADEEGYLGDVAEIIESDTGYKVNFKADNTPGLDEESYVKRIYNEFRDYKETCTDYIFNHNPLTDRTVLYIPITAESSQAMKQMYERLIMAVYYHTYCKLGDSTSAEKAKKLTERCLKWLDSTDFYTAPGSTVYHDAEPCGLLRHSLRVVDKLSELLKIPTFSMIDPCEAYLTALVHDWCKIDFYEQYLKNVKNEETGAWEKVPAYKCKGSSLPFGHGVTSMFMAQKCFRLSAEQALAIRWHMSRWNCSEKELVDLCDAEETFPMIHLLQFADQLAAAKY